MKPPNGILYVKCELCEGTGWIRVGERTRICACEPMRVVQGVSERKIEAALRKALAFDVLAWRAWFLEKREDGFLLCKHPYGQNYDENDPGCVYVRRPGSGDKFIGLDPVALVLEADVKVKP